MFHPRPGSAAIEALCRTPPVRITIEVEDGKRGDILKWRYVIEKESWVLHLLDFQNGERLNLKSAHL